MKLNSRIKKKVTQITSKESNEEIQELRKTVLPLEFQKWVDKYNKVGERNPLVWLLIFRFIEIVKFSPVSKKYQDSLLRSRFLSAMLVVLVDDAVDKSGSKQLKEELLNIPLSTERIQTCSLSEKEYSYLKFTLCVWQDFSKLIKEYPRYQELKDILCFDVLQIFNSMRFSALINNNPHLINLDEYWGYLPNSMQLMLHQTLNSMCSTEFNIKESGMIRKAVWHAQYMLRIGNCLGTWQKEIGEKDYSNGIFAYLIDQNILDIESLAKKKSIEARHIAQIENEFLNKWAEHYNFIETLAPKIKSFDVKSFLSQLEKILILHMSIKNI